MTDPVNVVITVPSRGTGHSWMPLVTDTMPDLNFNGSSQCFPLWRYRFRPAGLFGPGGWERRENITRNALRRYRRRYADPTIDRLAIFWHVYAVLSAPAYRARFAGNLRRELPRVPMPSDFWRFERAGRALGDLHLNDGIGCEWRWLGLEWSRPDPAAEITGDDFKMERRGLRWEDDWLRVNDDLRLGPIPPAVHRYEVNGRSPLDWLVRYARYHKDRRSGIVNDGRKLGKLLYGHDDPRWIVRRVRELVWVSLETVRIVEALPDPCPDVPFLSAKSSA